MATTSVNGTYHMTVGICLLLAFLLLINITASCPTGRVYLGNVNLSHIGQVGSNGVYTVQVGQVHAAHPVYKHTHRQLYIYFTRTNMGTYWVVAPNVTSNLSDVTIRMSSASSQPISTAETRWQLKQNGVWTTIPKLRTMCVNEDFGPCTSGKINVSGLPLTSRRQGRFMGSYSLYNISQSLRPIYIKDDGPEVLLYRHSLWVFTPDINSNSLGMFTKDSAFLPEFILEDWAYLGGFGLQSKRLKIKCIQDDNVETYAAAHQRGNGCSLRQSADTELQRPQPSTTLQPTHGLSNSSTRPLNPPQSGTLKNDNMSHGINASTDFTTPENATEMLDYTNGTVSIQNNTDSEAIVSSTPSLHVREIEGQSINTPEGGHIEQEKATVIPKSTEDNVTSESTEMPIHDNAGNDSHKSGGESRDKSILDEHRGREADAIVPRSNGYRSEVGSVYSTNPPGNPPTEESSDIDVHGAVDGQNGDITYPQTEYDHGEWQTNTRTQGMTLESVTGDMYNRDGNEMALELGTDSENRNTAQGMSLELRLTTESMVTNTNVHEDTRDTEHDSLRSAEDFPNQALPLEGSQQASSTTGCQEEVTSCENGQVIEQGSGSSRQVVCSCQQGYYGLRCEKEIRCGAAPAIAMATLQEVVEEGLMVMAVYTCDVGYHSDVGHVAVCGMDTRWQYLPECRSAVYSGYDWSEVAP